MKAISKRLLSFAIVLAMVLSMSPVIALPAAAAVTADPSTATDPMAAAAQNIADVKAWVEAYGALFKTEAALASGATVSAPCPFCSPTENVTWTGAAYFGATGTTSAAYSLVKGAHKYMTTNRTSENANFLTTVDDCTDYTAADAARCVYLNGFNLDSYKQRLWVGRGLNIIAYGSTFTQAATASDGTTTDTASYLIQMNEGPASIYGGEFINESTGKPLISAVSGAGILNLYDGTYTSTAGKGVILADKADGSKINIYGSKLTGGTNGTIVMTKNDTINVYGNDTYQTKITGGTGYVAGETYYTDENSATHYGTQGGNVYMSAGTFNLYGGEIYGGTATGIKDDAGDTQGGRGGNVYLGTNSTFNMYGGSVYGGQIVSVNGGPSYGGNVMLYASTAKLTMSGNAEIYGGQATNGGNVQLRSSNTMEMSGNAKVYNGKASTGPNIYLMNGSNPKLTMSGNATVYGGKNLSDETMNIRLYGGTLVMSDNATVLGGEGAGSAISALFSQNPLIVLSGNATVKSATGNYKNQIKEGRILITEGWAGEAYATLLIDDESRGYTYGEQIATTRALRGSYDADSKTVTAADVSFTGKLYVSSNEIEALADSTVTGGLVLAEEPATNAPVFGVFDPAGCEGMAYCEACYKQALAAGSSDADAKAAALKEWTAYEYQYCKNTSGNYKNDDSHEHLYLTEDLPAFAQTRLVHTKAGTICFNLNGKSVTKDPSATRAPLFHANGASAVLNIMDETMEGQGASVLVGVAPTTIKRGGAIWVQAGVVNLYGGTYQDAAPVVNGTLNDMIYRTVTVTYDDTLNMGGTLNMYEGAKIDGSAIDSTRQTVYIEGGTFNMHGGEIVGRAKMPKSNGGSVYVTRYANDEETVVVPGTFNMYGGVIRDGVAGNPDDPDETLRSGGNVAVNEGSIFNMTGGEIYGGYATGTNANVHIVDGCTFNMSSDAKIYSFTVETASGREKYASFADALANYQVSDAAYIGVWDTVEFTLTEDAYVALMVGCEPTISGGFDLYAMDINQEEDFNGNGTWTVNEGVNLVRDVNNPLNGDRYINVTTAATAEGVQTVKSYHLDMVLSAVSLRASTSNDEMGLYYKATISCDEDLAAWISSYGVVLSLANMPGADFMTDVNADGVNENGFTELTETLGVSADGRTVTINSGSVFGIMKTERTYADGTPISAEQLPAYNEACGKLPIYANAYLCLDLDGDGEEEFIMADTSNGGKVEADLDENGVAWSLYEVMKKIDTDWTKYEKVHDLVNNFYTHWCDYGMTWTFDNITKIETA